MYQKLFEDHARFLKAMAHPRRLEIVQLLREHSMSVSQMQEMLGLPQANLSQHLMVLRGDGVVTTNRKGKEVIYKLAHLNFAKASDLIRVILKEKYAQKGEISEELGIPMTELVPVVTDPVCKMRVSPKTAYYAHTHKGNKYYFCAAGCYESFKRSPEKFIE